MLLWAMVTLRTGLGPDFHFHKVCCFIPSCCFFLLDPNNFMVQRVSKGGLGCSAVDLMWPGVFSCRPDVLLGVQSKLKLL